MKDCIYHKCSWSKYIFLVLHVDDITSLVGVNEFEMKDLGDASFVLGIEII